MAPGRRDSSASRADAALHDFKVELQQRRNSYKLWHRPLATLQQFAHVLKENVQWLASEASQYPKESMVILAIASVLLTFLYGPDELIGALGDHRNEIRYHVEFVLMWVLLGILSSVGLGTGLHTFILFLGPHIVRVVVTASMCNSTDFTARIHWFQSDHWMAVVGYEDDAFECHHDSDGAVTFLQIVAKVSYPSIMWGLGTAIGELPPYFIARAAKLAGEKLDELEVPDTDGDAAPTLFDKARQLVFYYVEKYGFFAIMVFASVPNPLFDLAGLTCGHFGIAFWTFFLATAVGKALFKTTFQSVGYTMLFHKHTLDRVRTFLDAVFPPAAHLIDSMLHRVSLSIVKGCYAPHRIETGTCRSCCDELRLPVEPHAECVAKCDPENQVDAEETWAQAAWTLFIVGMITFFVVSIIHHSVHERVSREDNALIHAKREELEGKTKSSGKAAQKDEEDDRPQWDDEVEEEEDGGEDLPIALRRRHRRASAVALQSAAAATRGRRSSSRRKTRSPSRTRSRSRRRTVAPSSSTRQRRRERSVAPALSDDDSEGEAAPVSSRGKLLAKRTGAKRQCSERKTTTRRRRRQSTL